MFDALIEEPSSGWEERLRQLLPDDAALRAEVRSLLDADLAARAQPSRIGEHSGDLLGELAEHQEQTHVDAWIGRLLGVWRITRSLGHGGMGRVYLAERQDGEFRQQAAIKLLRVSDDEPGLQRFLAERQILAGLEHPGIARLLDGGRSSNGTPWFALEYVDGVTLPAWCDSQRLSVRARIRLFLDVCTAVAHAHEQLIIHRDLKPGNILVDRTGQVKLLDFGIAKLLQQDSEHTGTALRAYTPDYAAPEQIRGERMGTTVDVYALGVVLYELLTGCKPYRVEARTAPAIERAILEQQPIRPSQAAATTRSSDNNDDRDRHAEARGLNAAALGKVLRGDLDAIVLKALRKEPEARYRSVVELADDLRAVLEHRPVIARRGERRYIVQRFLRRNLLAVGLATTAVLALTIGLVAAIDQAREATRQRDSAQQSLRFMTGLFTNADPGRRTSTELTVEDLLDQGAREIGDALAGNVPARIDLMLAMTTGYIGLEALDRASELLAEARALAETEDDRMRLATIRLHECTIQSQRFEWQGCENLVEEIEGEIRPGSPEGNELLSSALAIRGHMRSFVRECEDAEVDLRRAIDLLPVSEHTLRLRVRLSNDLQYCLMRLGQVEEAEALVRARLLELEHASRPQPRLLADMLGALSDTLRGRDRDDERIELQREELRIVQLLYGPDSLAAINSLAHLAQSLASAGRWHEAVETHTPVVAYFRQHGSPDPGKVATIIGNSGVFHLWSGNHEQALALFEESLELLDNVDMPAFRAAFLRWYANALLLDGRQLEARQAIEQAMPLDLDYLSPDPLTMARMRGVYHTLALLQGSGPLPKDFCAGIDKDNEVFAASSDANSNDAAFGRFLGNQCRRLLVRSSATASTELDADSEWLQGLPETDVRRRMAIMVMSTLDDQLQ